MSAEPPDAPSAFGEFVKVGFLGAGSFGHVFHVRRGDEEFALKWLKPDAEADARPRFENEAWALQALDHPVIPRFIDRGEHNGRPWLVMTLAHGISLRALHEKQVRERTPCGQMRVLDIMIAVLDALTYMHARDVYHRDVKDGNVIAAESVTNVTLIDFGFCRGVQQPEHPPSFWAVGASRFGPPTKLDYPSEVHSTHDVFAVGVLAYLLLTNRFPWQVAESENRGRLRDAMVNTDPPDLLTINSFVDPEVAGLISRLLEINDDARPSAADALGRARELKSLLSDRVTGPAGKRDAIPFPRVIRDAVHGDIRMTEFEWSILNSREYQRLRGIKQLGLANLVFPGAEHTRLSHSIGTMHVADRILRMIEDLTGTRIPMEERLIARTYALVHDVTHVAYGHTFEDELAIFTRHDQNEPRALRMILGDKSALNNILRATEYGRAVLGMFDPRAGLEKRLEYVRELVESPAGADVLDYVDRDSLHCGLDHRVDSAIFRRFQIQIRREPVREQHLISRLYGQHGVRLDAEYALEALLLQRFSLFLKVYVHPAKTAAGAMLGKALTLAMDGKRKFIDEKRVEGLGDADLLSVLAEGPEPIRRLAKGVRERRLYKPCFRAGALKSGEFDLDHYGARREQLRAAGLLDPIGRLHLERKLARKAKTPHQNVIVYCSSEAPGFQKIRYAVEREPGKTEPLGERVHLRAAERHLRLWSVFVFADRDLPKEKLQAIVDEMSDHTSMTNEADVKPRQQPLF